MQILAGGARAPNDPGYAERRMPNTPAFRVFISAATEELGSFRREIARVLRRRGLEVRDQEHFSQGPATLLERLRDYIRSCDAVVVLVGERCGSFPTDAHAGALGGIAAFDDYCRVTGNVAASYTQWEFLLAREYDKPIYTFMTAGASDPDTLNEEPPLVSAQQRAYREYLSSLGMHRGEITTAPRLVEDVLVLDLPDLTQTRFPLWLTYRDVQLWWRKALCFWNLTGSDATTPGAGVTATRVLLVGFIWSILIDLFAMFIYSREARWELMLGFPLYYFLLVVRALTFAVALKLALRILTLDLPFSRVYPVVAYSVAAASPIFHLLSLEQVTEALRAFYDEKVVGPDHFAEATTRLLDMPGAASSAVVRVWVCVALEYATVLIYVFVSPTRVLSQVTEGGYRSLRLLAALLLAASATYLAGRYVFARGYWLTLARLSGG